MHQEVFNTSGSWTAPTEVASTIQIIVYGGGGSGRTNTSASIGGGGGGGGGEAQKDAFAVTPGNVYSYTIGAGATPGVGTNGGDTFWVNATTLKTGGGGSSTGFGGGTGGGVAGGTFDRSAPGQSGTSGSGGARGGAGGACANSLYASNDTAHGAILPTAGGAGTGIGGTPPAPADTGQGGNGGASANPGATGGAAAGGGGSGAGVGQLGGNGGAGRIVINYNMNFKGVANIAALSNVICTAISSLKDSANCICSTVTTVSGKRKLGGNATISATSVVTVGSITRTHNVTLAYLAVSDVEVNVIFIKHGSANIFCVSTVSASMHRILGSSAAPAATSLVNVTGIIKSAARASAASETVTGSAAKVLRKSGAISFATTHLTCQAQAAYKFVIHVVSQSDIECDSKVSLKGSANVNAASLVTCKAKVLRKFSGIGFAATHLTCQAKVFRTTSTLPAFTPGVQVYCAARALYKAVAHSVAITSIPAITPTVIRSGGTLAYISVSDVEVGTVRILSHVSVNIACQTTVHARPGPIKYGVAHSVAQTTVAVGARAYVIRNAEIAYVGLTTVTAGATLHGIVGGNADIAAQTTVTCNSTVHHHFRGSADITAQTTVTCNPTVHYSGSGPIHIACGTTVNAACVRIIYQSANVICQTVVTAKPRVRVPVGSIASAASSIVTVSAGLKRPAIVNITAGPTNVTCVAKHTVGGVKCSVVTSSIVTAAMHRYVGYAAHSAAITTVRVIKYSRKVSASAAISAVTTVTAIQKIRIYPIAHVVCASVVRCAAKRTPSILASVSIVCSTAASATSKVKKRFAASSISRSKVTAKGKTTHFVYGVYAKASIKCNTVVSVGSKGIVVGRADIYSIVTLAVSGFVYNYNDTRIPIYELTDDSPASYKSDAVTTKNNMTNWVLEDNYDSWVAE
jgi:hypothetical protein